MMNALLSGAQLEETTMMTATETERFHTALNDIDSKSPWKQYLAYRRALGLLPKTVILNKAQVEGELNTKAAAAYEAFVRA